MDHWEKTTVLRASRGKKTGHINMAARRPQNNAFEIINENDIQLHAVKLINNRTKAFSDTYNLKHFTSHTN